LGTSAVKRLSTPSADLSSSEDNMVYHPMYFSQISSMASIQSNMNFFSKFYPNTAFPKNSSTS